MTDIFPFVRIALYALAGYLAGQGADSWVVDYIRTDPDLAAAVVGAVAGVWYAAAKRWGWAK
jgi:uncharacterized PurR-regulated membrane protein YhhQ (DUF165 family)